MEHSCHKCAQPVEDGVPFCSHCAAPQIRVVMPEPQPAVIGSGTAIPPPESSDVPHLQPATHLTLHRAQVLRSSAAAALLALVAMLLGLAVPAALLGGGFVAVAFYRRRNPGVAVRAAQGAGIGAAGGFLCFVFSGIVATIAATVTDVRAKFREQLLEAMQKAASRSNDPQVQAALESLKTPEGLVIMMAVALVMLFVLFILVAGIGGALGGAIYGRRDRT